MDRHVMCWICEAAVEDDCDAAYLCKACYATSNGYKLTEIVKTIWGEIEISSLTSS